MGKEKMAHKCQKSVLYLPRQCYKSALCDKLQSDEFLFIDIDDMVRSDPQYAKLKSLHGEQQNILLKELYQRLYKHLKLKFVKEEKRKLVMVSSNIRLVSKFYNKHVFLCMPSKSLKEQIMVNLDDKPELLMEFKDSYERFLHFLQKDSSVCVFDNFDELLAIVMSSYKIKSCGVL